MLKSHFGWQGEALSNNDPAAFPIHVSKVDFNWFYLVEKIPMFLASGILGIDFENNSLSPKLGYVVCEYDAP